MTQKLSLRAIVRLHGNPYDEFRFSFASSCRPCNDDLDSRI
ncbi:hypothetical protein [Helicobacter fennelliae]|nr:hypothetical protein [Helicobacter fennelliae]